MTLRLRLALLFGAMALVTAALYGSLTFVLYQRQQWSQLESLLTRELGRMEGALANPRVGVPWFETDRGGTIVQLVTNGRVVLPRPAGATLPATETAQVVQHAGGYFLTALRPLSGDSSVRVGLEVTDEVLARADLARKLIWLGLLLALVASLTAAVLTRRSLAPLVSVARQARSVDPVNPQSVEYYGPDDEVAQVASALNSALENIQRRRQEERSFLAEVAHELAAPLTLVKGHLDAYERDSSAIRARSNGDYSGADNEHLRAAREAAQELLLTSQDLLALARGELDRPIQNEVIRVDELLVKLARAYPGVRFDSDGSVRVVGDAHQLLQAIRNLVRNAVQASGAAEGVQVELRDDGQRVELRVRDSGPGIPPDRLERIFDRYFSGTTGAGVGLTVVSRIVEQHGGELLVDTDSSGSCFTMVLPSFATQLGTQP